MRLPKKRIDKEDKKLPEYMKIVIDFEFDFDIETNNAEAVVKSLVNLHSKEPYAYNGPKEYIPFQK